LERKKENSQVINDATGLLTGLLDKVDFVFKVSEAFVDK
jgi:hypothetical protein